MLAQIGPLLTEEELQKIPDRSPDVEYRWHPRFTDYVVGDDGRIYRTTVRTRSIYRPRNPYLLRKSYLGLYETTLIGSEGSRIMCTVHTLVLETFKGKPPLGDEAAHLNGNPHDNRASNLAWKTHKANEADKVRHGTLVSGERHPWAKLTADQVRRIRILGGQGVHYSDLAVEYDKHPETIRFILTRKNWKHVA